MSISPERALIASLTHSAAALPCSSPNCAAAWTTRAAASRSLASGSASAQSATWAARAAVGALHRGLFDSSTRPALGASSRGVSRTADRSIDCQWAVRAIEALLDCAESFASSTRPAPNP
eukprot:1475842-Prymnesium_polylepis.2